MPDLLLRDLVLIYALAVLVVLAFARLRLPPLIGFLLTGVLVGPHGLALVRSVHEVEVLAEVGVVLLLFGVGVEFSLGELRAIGRLAVVGGGLQVAGTTLAAALVARGLGFAWRPAIFLGMVVALSSTAVVLKLLGERGELAAPHGRAALGMLLFQDLCVPAMVLAVPWLAGVAGAAGSAPAAAGKAILVAGGAVLAARWVVPAVLERVVATRSREVFLLAVILLCLGAAWATQKAGLSLALGAFVAGLILSASPYSLHALAEILPFRDALACLFFVSIGMLVDPALLSREPLQVGAWVLGLLVVKATVVAAAVRVLGWPLRPAVWTGLVLAQVGEFSFVLSRAPGAEALLPLEPRQLLLAAAVVTMALTPLLAAVAPALVRRLPVPARALPRGPEPAEDSLRDHVVIVGYGLNGRNLARVLHGTGIPYVILEANPQTVRAEAARGEPIRFGDASRVEVLDAASVRHARVMVVAISDPAAARRIAQVARRLHPRLHLLVRTRYVREVEPLRKLGASEVIPEEFETSVEIFARVLHEYLVPRDRIEACVAEVRREEYGMLRGSPRARSGPPDVRAFLPGMSVDVMRVEPDSDLDGRTLAGAALRTTSGVTVLGVRRGDRFEAAPGPAAVLRAGDEVLVLGDPDLLAAAFLRFRRPAARASAAASGGNGSPGRKGEETEGPATGGG